MTENAQEKTENKEKETRSRGSSENEVRRESYGPEGGMLSDEISTRIQSQRGSGSQLSRGQNEAYSRRFGRDMSDVRIHSDEESSRLNETLNSRAFTIGADVFLGRGIDPQHGGRDSQTLTHELTHVVQQDGKATSGRLRLGATDTAEEHEASSESRRIPSRVSGGNTVRREDKPAEEKKPTKSNLKNFFRNVGDKIIQSISPDGGEEFKKQNAAEDRVRAALNSMNPDERKNYDKVVEDLKAEKAELEKEQKSVTEVDAWKNDKSKQTKALTKNQAQITAANEAISQANDVLSDTAAIQYDAAGHAVKSKTEFEDAGIAQHYGIGGDEAGKHAKQKIAFLQSLLRHDDVKGLSYDKKDAGVFMQDWDNHNAVLAQYKDDLGDRKVDQVLKELREDIARKQRENGDDATTDEVKEANEKAIETDTQKMERLESAREKIMAAEAFTANADNKKAHELIEAIQGRISEYQKSIEEQEKKLAEAEAKKKRMVTSPAAAEDEIRIKYGLGPGVALNEMQQEEAETARKQHLDDVKAARQEDVEKSKGKISGLEQQQLQLLRDKNSEVEAEDVERYYQNGAKKFFKSLWGSFKSKIKSSFSVFTRESDESVAKKPKDESEKIGTSVDEVDEQIKKIEEALAKANQKTEETVETSFVMGKDAESLGKNMETLQRRRRQLQFEEENKRRAERGLPPLKKGIDVGTGYKELQESAGALDEEIQKGESQSAQISDSRLKGTKVLDPSKMTLEQMRSASEDLHQRIEISKKLTLSQTGLTLESSPAEIDAKIVELTAEKGKTKEVEIPKTTGIGTDKINIPVHSREKIAEFDRLIASLTQFKAEVTASLQGQKVLPENATQDDFLGAIAALKEERKRRAKKKFVFKISDELSDEELAKLIKELELRKNGGEPQEEEG